MSDLLRLNKLFVTRQYEDDGALIIETKSKNPRAPKRMRGATRECRSGA